MDYPVRCKTHISETKSFNIVSSSLPETWIIRELTERDYGIDLYVEIVKPDGRVTGDLIALQIKSKNSFKFNKKGNTSLNGVKRSTLNYWEGLPVPVFVLYVNLDDESVYWCNIKGERRNGSFYSESSKIKLTFNKSCDLSEQGLTTLVDTYFFEKEWGDIENSIERSLMSFSSLGPLVLMCRRKRNSETCTTSIQYLLIQHYENYTILSKYLLRKKNKNLSHWYERNIEIQKKTDVELNFSYELIKEMLSEFVSDYRDCIIYAYKLVTEIQQEYFLNKKQFLVTHLKNRPHTFMLDDWFSRYYFDEYENETLFPEKLFFNDFSEFDSDLEGIRCT